MNKEINEQYKKTVEKYEEQAIRLLTCRRELADVDAELEKLTISAMNDQAFGACTNDPKRKAFIGAFPGVAEVKAKREKLEQSVLEVSTQIDITSKWVSYWKHTLNATSGCKC